MSVESFYDLTPLDWRGNAFPFAQLKGKVVLIVNSASQCGFTPQYAGLEALYEKYKARGFIVLVFPCDQFGNQEPGSNAEIHEFCSVNFGVTFPIMDKVEVNRFDADPVFHFLKSQVKGKLGFGGIMWNFEKFLVDQTGNVTHRWPSTVVPSDIEYVIDRTLNGH